MARNAPTKVIITSSISDLVSDINDISFDLGATGRLNTNQDSDVVGAINELHDSLGDALLTTTAKQVKEAINEIDAELGTISSGAMGTIASTVSGAIAELDSDRDDLITVVAPNTGITTTATTVTGAINEIDALQGNVSLTTTATTVTGAIVEHEADIGNMTFTGLTATNISAAVRELRTELGDHSTLTTTVTSNAIGAINEIDALQGDSAMGTKASTVTGAIAELHDSIGGALLTTTATQIKEAINELDAEIGGAALTTTAQTLAGAVNEHDTEIGSASLNTSATTLRGAINELHTEIGDAIGSANNTTTGNIGQSLNLLDSAIGDMTALDANINDRSTLVLAINSLQADIELLDSDTTSFDSKVGSLSSLNAGFTGSERTSVVNALNALYLSIPEIYDENGVQLN